MTVAKHRSSFPKVVGAFDRGELSFEQMLEVVKAPAWADAKVHYMATISTVSKLRRAMRSKNFDGEPDPPPEPAKTVNGGRVPVRAVGDGERVAF